MPHLDEVIEHRLDNGLHVLLMPEPSSPTVTVNVTYRVGSRHEQDGESGLAHLIEHVMFAGTRRFPRLLEACADRGIRVNGNTSVDRTAYLAAMTANDHHLRWLLDVEADRMIDRGFTQEDLDRERGVILSELAEVENHAYRLLSQRVAAAAYRWHSYRRPVIGAMPDLEALDLAAVRRFHQRFYRPDGATLTIAGRIDPAATLTMIDESFGHLTPAGHAADDTGSSAQGRLPGTTEPPQDGERLVMLRRAAGEHLIMSAFHIPAARHPDFVPIVVLSRLLSDAPWGRLRTALVATDLASSVITDTAYAHDPGLMTHCVTLPKSREPGAARAEMMRVLDGFANQPVTDEEFERACRTLTKHLTRALGDVTRLAVSIGHYIGAGDWRLGFLHQQQADVLTKADVQRVADAYLHGSNRTVGVLESDRSTRLVHIPPAPAVAATPTPGTGRSVSPVRPVWAKRAVREASTPPPADGLPVRVTPIRFTLTGGHKVVMAPGRSADDRLAICIRLHHGDEASLWGKSRLAEAAGCLLTRGTASLHGLALKDALDRLDCHVMARGWPAYAELTIDVASTRAADALRTIGGMIREPDFRLDDLDDWRRTRSVAAENGRHDPRQTAELTLKRCLSAYPPGDPRYVPSFAERVSALAALTIEDVRRFHAEFVGASHGATAVVGPLDEQARDEVSAVLEDVFGDWRNATPSTWPAPAYRRAEPVNLTIRVTDRGNAHLMVALPVPVSSAHAAYPALVAATYVLGGSMTSRLLRRLRHEEHLSYLAGADFSDTPLSDRNVFLAYAMARPQDLLEAEQLLVAELESAVRDGFTEQEVDLAKAGVIRARQSERANNRGLAAILAADTVFNLAPDRWESFRSHMNRLSADDVHTAFSAYIDTSRLTIIKAGDLADSAPEPLDDVAAPTPSSRAAL
jgi:zinc protease